MSTDPKRKPPITSMDRYDWSKARRGRYAARFPHAADAPAVTPCAPAVVAALAICILPSSQYLADAFFPDGKSPPQTAHFMLAL